MTSTDRFRRAVERFDGANAEDPNRELVDGAEQPKELVYARRMTACLDRFRPDAPEAVRLAARCAGSGPARRPLPAHPALDDSPRRLSGRPRGLSPVAHGPGPLSRQERSRAEGALAKLTSVGVAGRRSAMRLTHPSTATMPRSKALTSRGRETSSSRPCCTRVVRLSHHRCSCASRKRAVVRCDTSAWLIVVSWIFAGPVRRGITGCRGSECETGGVSAGRGRRAPR